MSNPYKFDNKSIVQTLELKQPSIPVIGVSNNIFINNTTKLLLGRRVGNQLLGTPGGHVEPLETIVEAAVRETFEETKLDLKAFNIKTRLIGQLYNTFRVPVVISYVCETFIDGSLASFIQDSEEISDWGWYDITQPIDNLFYPTKEVIKVFNNQLIGEGWYYDTILSE